jgi:hypothetical protein
MHNFAPAFDKIRGVLAEVPLPSAIQIRPAENTKPQITPSDEKVVSIASHPNFRPKG